MNEAPIKKLKIIPDNALEFIKSVVGLDVSQDVKDFLFECLKTEVVDDEPTDDFYIDLPFSYNFYNTEKKKDPRFTIRCFQSKFNTRELNYFTYESNFRKGDYYLKPKSMDDYEYMDDYYDYVSSKISEYEEFDNNTVIVETPITEQLNDLVFKPKVMKKFKLFLQELYEMGLWLDRFDNYNIRYDSKLDEFFVYDPDSFIIIEHDKKLSRIENFDQFMYLFEQLKLRGKNTIYRLKNNVLTEEAANYMYYSYWFLENFSQRMK